MYFRHNNDAIIFESKDILINASLKRSRDFKIYEPELRNKLYYLDTGTGKSPKAVLQLINNVKRVLAKEFTFDNTYTSENLNIFPILVLHDHMFDMPGLNVLVNHWFQTELQLLREQEFYIEKVKPLILISIDFFILHQDVLRADFDLFIGLLQNHLEITSNLPLKKREYASEADLEEIMHNISTPFALTGYNFLRQSKLLQIPEMLHEYGLSLLKHEKNADT